MTETKTFCSQLFGLVNLSLLFVLSAILKLFQVAKNGVHIALSMANEYNETMLIDDSHEEDVSEVETKSKRDKKHF